MDQVRNSGGVNPELIAASVKSVITTYQQESAQRQEQIEMVRANVAAYPVADLFGRCFLRMCQWVDVFTGWTRRAEFVAHAEWKKSNSRRVRTRTATEVPISSVAIPVSVDEHIAESATVQPGAMPSTAA